MKTIKLQEFMEHLKLNMNNSYGDSRKFCFILGSGASRQSGIPTGGELASEWLNQIEKIYGYTKFNEWKSAIGVKSGYEAEMYSEIFEKRFELNRKEGYLFLESKMEKVSPSYGYAILARILESTIHNVVITTNFDSLVEDAMFIYTKKKPLVIGHESLAGYISIFSKRPIVAKIHRDLLLSPKNTQNEIEILEKNWEEYNAPHCQDTK